MEAQGRPAQPEAATVASLTLQVLKLLIALRNTHTWPRPARQRQPPSRPHS